MDGMICMNKPRGMTSYDVIRFLKRTFKPTEKIGHAGTLDPLAEGVLLVCLGRGTRLSQLLMGEEKEYVARLRLGTTTDTLDTEGRVMEERPVNATAEMVAAVPARFTGEIEQVPPVVSALKHKGQPLYKLYRKGIAVDPQPRKVLIREIEILSFETPFLDFRVVCSKGTYVRSLCRDIGEHLGCGAVQVSLKRTRIGPFRIENALLPEDVGRRGLAASVIPAHQIVAMLKR